jgi:MFS superfamily sulfate permease-like transporter
MTWKRWLWVAFVAILAWNSLLVGALVAIATAFYWLLNKSAASASKPESVDDEPYKSFDICEPRYEKRSGWNTLTVYANRYEDSLCFGGPPSHEDVYEYIVTDKRVYQRLVHRTLDDFFRTTNEHKIVLVNAGVIVEESLKILEAENDIIYKDDRYDVRPNEHAELTQRLGWHEVPQDYIRYALWAFKNIKQRDVIIAECARLSTAFHAFDVAAKKLGAQRDEWGRYKGGESDLKVLMSAEGLEPYGVTRGEVIHQELILRVLNAATPKAVAAAAGR